MPFFGRETGPNSVSIRGNLQAIMDQEIAYAANAGIDYWAFVSYHEKDPLSNALHLYLASSAKKRIHFCLDLQGGIMVWMPDWHQEVARYVGYFKDPQYQTVLDHRPLVYLLQPGKMQSKKWPDWLSIRAAIDELRQSSIAAGAGNPYIVVQGYGAAEDKTDLELIGADAISAYAVSGGEKEGPPYAELAKKASARWDEYKQTGAQVIPLVTSGWDHRTRAEHPLPWDSGGWLYYQTPTPAELAQHLTDALQWVRSNPTADQADAILIYAWNEHDEGGWICPTWNVPTQTIDTQRLDAIAQVLHQRAAQ
jgi:hypothetical protein